MSAVGSHSVKLIIDHHHLFEPEDSMLANYFTGIILFGHQRTLEGFIINSVL